MIQLAGCHATNPSNGSDTGMDRYVICSKTLDLVAGVPADMELGSAIILEGRYRNTAESPANGALLFSSGDAWPGYEPDWVLRLQPFG